MLLDNFLYVKIYIELNLCGFLLIYKLNVNSTGNWIDSVTFIVYFVKLYCILVVIYVNEIFCRNKPVYISQDTL